LFDKDFLLINSIIHFSLVRKKNKKNTHDRPIVIKQLYYHPKDLKASDGQMIIRTLLNPGAFEFNGKKVTL
jgi:hypothetical protein